MRREQAERTPLALTREARNGNRAAARRVETVREAQRMRIVLGLAQAAREVGVAEVTVADITARGGVSRRTFYEMFDNVADCRLAAFEEGVRRAAIVVVPAYRSGGVWRERIWNGLAALLRFLDEQPVLGGYCVVDALGAGTDVLTSRDEAMGALINAVDEGREVARSHRALSRLTAEGLVGAVLSILHARIMGERERPLTQMQGELMSLIVRPYLGPAAAAAELERPLPDPPTLPSTSDTDLLRQLGIRWTYRTIRTLTAIGSGPGASNREVGAAAGVTDQGQISKLLARLQRLGLVENEGGPAYRGEPNAWRLTAKGAEVEAIVRRQIGRP